VSVLSWLWLVWNPSSGHVLGIAMNLAGGVVLVPAGVPLVDIEEALACGDVNGASPLSSETVLGIVSGLAAEGCMVPGGAILLGTAR
jgi:hypothetical protein